MHPREYQTRLFSPVAIQKALNRLLQDRRITPACYAVACQMLWRCRARGQERIKASMACLARLSGRARSTVQLAIACLVDLGVLARRRTCRRIGWRVLRDASVYWFTVEETRQSPMKPTDTDGRSGYPQMKGLLRKSGARWAVRGPERTVAEQLRLLREG